MRFAWALLGACFALGCSDTTSSVASLWVAPGSLDDLREDRFFDAPWPSDLRRVDGAPRLAGYFNPRQMPLLADYITEMDAKLDGFSPAGAGFIRFTGAIDPASLPPNPLFAMSAESSVQLVDVDPASPERGRRQRVSLHWREQPGIYWPANTLAFMPTLGYPLRPKTRYALVVTDAVQGADGGPIQASADLRRALGIDSPDERTEHVAEALAPAVAELGEAGLDPARIAHLTVFTTSDPAGELFALRDHLIENVPPPAVLDESWVVRNVQEEWEEYLGVYGPSPNYQTGELPFTSFGDGGAFRYDEAGEPVVADYFDLRFSITVPKVSLCPMPEAGYPIVLYAHGTGGDYRSYVYERVGRLLAKRCVATMGVDQIFHGYRPGAPSDDGVTALLFFNFQNVVAARTNTRQAALDEVQRARLFTETNMTIPASVTVSEQEIRFDPSKLMFFGHSQGGLNGPLFLAADDAVRGGVLSGASSVMAITLLEKTKPSPSVAGLVETVFLGLKGEEVEELNLFHPAISLAQMIVDVVDPIHYARSIALEPRAGFSPKSVYMTEGVNPDGTGDSYAPPHGIEVHGVAMGLPLQQPAQWPIEEARWGGAGAVTVPAEGLSGNLPGGAASGVLAQWAVPEGRDGHFVIFDVEAARDQAHTFLENLAAEPAGRVPAP